MIFFFDVFFKLLFILCNEILKSKVIRSLITWLFNNFFGGGGRGVLSCHISQRALQVTMIHLKIHSRSKSVIIEAK